CISRSVFMQFHPEGTSGSSISLHIEGMDCASCVAKIETTLARLPGVSDIHLNFTAEKLDLRLASDSGIQATDIARTIRSLGFGASIDSSSRATSDIDMEEPATTVRRWWQTRK